MIPLFIGQNLKRLRTERDLTQEALAELLGVSAQAVSRWESGATCPDLSLLPGIANLFEVSLDELFGMDKLRAPEALRGFFDRECKARASGDLDTSECELRRGLRLFPGDHGLMNELALTLTRAYRNTDEAIGLCERVLAESTSTKLRATTAADLVILYMRSGECERARSLAESLPHIRECRELMRCEVSSDYKLALKAAAHECMLTLCELIDTADTHVTGERQPVPRMIADGLGSELSTADATRRVCEFLLSDE